MHRDHRVPPFHAAVRLVRWLAVPSSEPAGDLLALARRHGEVDGWVDSAVNDAVAGVSDPELGAGLSAVLAAARARRKAHDTAFAVALAAHTAADPEQPKGSDSGVWLLEDLLPHLVIPLAKSAPSLLLVLDGMSVGVATEVVADILRRPTDGWVEALPAGLSRRPVALTVLPSLTETSRASLLCGELRTGDRTVEADRYAQLAGAHGLPKPQLFHKKLLDSSRPGFAVADDVGTAIDDTTGCPLVTCVLNTIDDALDRSDPGGTDWTAEAVRHLRPLLERARLAGRVVVLTADGQVRALLTALLGAPGHRLSPAQAAMALAVPISVLRGAVLHVQRLLNVESYPVLRVDADGATVVLDEQLLVEQFGVSA